MRQSDGSSTWRHPGSGECHTEATCSPTGTRLLERSTRSMRLTPQWHILLDYAKRAFDLLAEGTSQVTTDRAALVGSLRIAAPSDLARNTLLPWCSGLLALHLGVQLVLTASDKPRDVVRDEVDVALRFGAPRAARGLRNQTLIRCSRWKRLSSWVSPLPNSG